MEALYLSIGANFAGNEYHCMYTWYKAEINPSGTHASLLKWCKDNDVEWPLASAWRAEKARKHAQQDSGASIGSTTTGGLANLTQRLEKVEPKYKYLRRELAVVPAGRDDLRQLKTELEQWKAKTSELQALLCLDDGPDIQASSEIRRRQIAFIVATAQALGYDPLSIPDGGKQEIKAACLALPKLFTEESFSHAWKVAVGGYVRMANHERFARRE